MRCSNSSVENSSRRTSAAECPHADDRCEHARLLRSPCGCRHLSRQSRRCISFLDNLFQKIDGAVAVAPLVVIPTDELEEVLIELDSAARVEDRGMRVVNEV